MPASKNKKNRRNTPRTGATTNAPSTAETAAATTPQPAISAEIRRPLTTARTPSGGSMVNLSAFSFVFTEMKMIGLVTVILIVLLAVLYIVLR
jgi:hypothetical protein